jgi:LAO/AO transport system kinase
VARRTREASLACEAAGHDVILIETMGVGQSETAVADMVDCFVLLLAPAGGDGLQGIKRGIVEQAHLVLINKADGDLLPAANLARAEYEGALHLLRPANPAWTPEVLTCSALHGEGIEAVWDAVRRHHDALEAAGELVARRARQSRSWLWAEVQAGLTDALRGDPDTRSMLEQMETAVREGRRLPSHAARELVARFRRAP